MEITSKAYALIGDCGGTNSRLQLCRFSEENSQAEIIKCVFYSTTQYPGGLLDLLPEFLKDVPRDSETYPTIAVIAMGCTVRENVSDYFENSGWPRIVGEEVAQKLGFKQCTLLNDFVARGWGVLELNDGDTTTINKGEPSRYGTKVVLGPGTGLGLCYINYYEDSSGKMLAGVHQSEAPCGYFPAHDQTEWDFIRFYLDESPKWDYLTVGQSCGGRVITLMYQYFAEKEGKIIDHKDYSSSKVLKMFQEDKEEIAIRAVNHFIKTYGEIASNAAMTFLPYGGIYLTSSITSSLLEDIQRKDGPFFKGYYNKRPFNSMLEGFPVHVVNDVELGLTGCCLLAHRKLFNK